MLKIHILEIKFGILIY